MESQADYHFMQRALELARQGVGLAAPNPCVGAVVVDDHGKVVGWGTHLYEGRKHAEILALEEAGEKARGATLYLTLEPCCHIGRTGPCVDAVIGAGIRRVVAAMPDPNPRVGGKSFAQLRAAGIEVAVGEGQAEARKLIEAFAKYIRTGSPLVTLKAAMTLDGKIAPPPGESASPSALGAFSAYRGWITGEAAHAHVQELRHASDAILVGIGTVIADDPLLTDRSGKPRRRPLLRVVLDSRLRLPLECRLVKTAHQDVLIFCGYSHPEKRAALEARGVRVEQLPLDAGASHPALVQVLQRLGQLEITSLLIEGGALVNSSALSMGVVDKVFLYYAPKIMGSSGAVQFVGGGQALEKALQVRSPRLHQFGEDFAVEGYLKDPYEA